MSDASPKSPDASSKPGRLGNPRLQMNSDPRSDPRMITALAPFQLDGAVPPPPVERTSPREAQLEYLEEAEAGFEAVPTALMNDLPQVEGLDHFTETITGVDGNEIKLYLSRPSGAKEPLPGVLHFHGGGMLILSAAGAVYRRFRAEIAQTGTVVIGVEFRNGAGALGTHPFPAGLNDCTTALHWVSENRESLGLSTLVLAGESGGANLALATTLKAKQDGHLNMIAGVYGMVPYISGIYGRSEAERIRELPSLVENDGYFITCALLDVMATVYDPDGKHTTNPLCWPYHATVDDLRGLPPHVISVNEVDPLRDEGLAYHHKLESAGVEAMSVMLPGACHAADLMFRGAMPEIYGASVAGIHDFAAGL